MIKIKLVLGLLLSFFAQTLFAQLVYVKENARADNEISTITIMPGTSLTINGNLTGQSQNMPSPKFIKNFGSITLTGNLRNLSTGSFFDDAPTAGRLSFIGNNTSIISGSHSVSFFKIVVNKASGIRVDTNIIVRDTLDLQLGNVLLNNENINLIYTDKRFGKIINETNDRRIYGQGEIITQNIPVSKVDSLGIGLKINYQSSSHQVNIKRGHTSLVQVADGSIKKYFDIGTVDTLPGSTITIHYFDADFAGLKGNSETDFKLWYSNEYDFTKLGGTVDIDNDTLSYTGTLRSGRYTIADEICNETPEIDLGLDINYCQGTPITLQNNLATTSNKFNFLWITNNGTDTLTTDTITIDNYTGKIKLRVTNQDGCFSWDSVNVKVNPLPVAYFKTKGEILTNASCLGQNIEFTDSSTVSSGPIASLLWQFGDGTTSTNTEITKKYNQAGTYAVKLRTTTEAGCYAEMQKEVEINPLPVVNYSFENVCLGNMAVFQSSSTDDTGINMLTWDYGDATERLITVDNNSPVNHSYTTYGTFTSKLIVQSTEGCLDSLSGNIEVYPPVHANFSVADDCSSKQFIFSNSSTAENSTIVNYSWNLGGLATATNESPQYQFNSPGNYDVNLTVTSDYGCISQITKQLNVYPLPQVDFYFADQCNGQQANFDNNSLISEGLIVAYDWSFGDGNISSDSDPQYTYTSKGAYQVILEAESANGCRSSLTKEINIFDKPTANFFAENVCLGQETKFVNTSGIESESLNYSWDFDNGNVSNLENPQIAYQNAQQYNVKLEVVSENGCSNEIEKLITVNPNPELDLGGNIVTCGELLVIDALNPGANYLWSDNTTNQTNTIQADGNYFVIVTNQFGCSHKENFGIQLLGEFLPNLGNDTTVCGELTLNAFNPSSSYQWSTGENSNSIEVSESGNYSVTVTDQNSCVGTDEINVTVHPLPQVDLGNDISSCENEPQQLQPVSNANTFLWSDNSNQSYLNVNTSGIYWVKATNEFSCSAYDTVLVTITELPKFSLNDVTFCGNGVLDAGNKGSSFLWSDGSTGQTLTINESGNYWVKIAASETCSIINSATVTVNELPIISIPDYVEICDGDSVLLDATNINSSYFWSTGETGSNIFVSEPGLYSVDVTNELNCSLTKFVSIIKNQRPGINLGGNKILCTNDTIILNAGSDGTDYYWYLDDKQISTAHEISVYQPGTYKVIVTNNKACTNTDSVRIEQTEFDLLANFIVASDIYVGDTIQFINLSEPSTDSYLWNFGDGSSSNVENPQHKYYISSDFSVSLIIQKGECSDEITKTINVKRRLKSASEDQVLGGGNPFEIKKFNVFPNPNNGEFRSEIILSQPEDVYVILIDINGSTVYRNILRAFDHYEQEYSFNLKSGMYIMSIISRGILKSRKLIIIK